MKCCPLQLIKQEEKQIRWHEFTKELDSKIEGDILMLVSLSPELKTLECWISISMLDLLFFLISRLNYACSPLVNNLQIILLIGIKDIPFKNLCPDVIITSDF